MIKGKLNNTTIGQFAARNRRLKRLGFASYQDFLNSDIWKRLKHFAMEKPEFQKCVICGNTKYIILHHRRYTNLHNIHSLKKMSRDLVSLCRNCHEKVHVFNLSSKGDGLTSSVRKVKRKSLTTLI
jgi:hypothetical protein